MKIHLKPYMQKITELLYLTLQIWHNSEVSERQGRDQVGIKAQKFKLCPDVCSEVNDDVNSKVHANVIRI